MNCDPIEALIGHNQPTWLDGKEGRLKMRRFRLKMRRFRRSFEHPVIPQILYLLMIPYDIVDNTICGEYMTF